MVALNTLPWPRKEIVEISDTGCMVASGNGNILALEKFIPAQSELQVTIHEVSTGVFQLQNNQLSVTVEKGCITSLYDRKADRELISKSNPSKANRFVIFDDKPIYWQAWDVEVYHLDTREELTGSTTYVHEDKPHRVSVVTEIKISENSSIKSTVALSAAFDGRQSCVECTADVDWHETMKFLKVEFPVDIRNTEAAYETQYGIIKRPTHYNTSCVISFPFYPC